MTKITFHGGVNEIGGNKILIEDKDSKIFLDFGKNFEKERAYFDEPFIMAKEESNLIELGILPNINCLYKKDEKECGFDGIFITHAHLDHYGSIINTSGFISFAFLTKSVVRSVLVPCVRKSPVYTIFESEVSTRRP